MLEIVWLVVCCVLQRIREMGTEGGPKGDEEKSGRSIKIGGPLWWKLEGG